MLHGLHLGDGGHRALEILKADTALGGQRDAQKHRHPEPQRGAVQHQPPPGDGTLVMQPAHPPPAGRLAQPQLPPQRPGAQRRILRQRPQDRTVGFIKRDHSGSSSPRLISAICISASISAICGRVRMRVR